MPWFQGLAPQVPDTVVIWSVWFSFLQQESTAERPPGKGRIPYSEFHRKHGNHAEEYALRQEKALLLTFAAGQKYVGRRAETRRFYFWFERKTKSNF